MRRMRQCSCKRRSEPGLGWSPMPFYTTTDMICPDNRVPCCVTSDPADQTWANQRTGSTTRCLLFRAFLTRQTKSCTTASGYRGQAYCCHDLTPHQETVARAGRDPFASGGPLVCESSRTPRDQMANALQRAVWDIKDKLCTAGMVTDPGPVNGDVTPDLTSALRRYQRDHGVAVSGRWDAATGQAMGFTDSQISTIGSALQGSSIGPAGGGGLNLGSLVYILPVVLGVGGGIGAIWLLRKVGV